MTLLSSINPVSGQLIQQYTADSPQQLQDKITSCHQAWLSYRQTSYAERKTHLLRLADLLQERKEPLSRLMALEMGKPLKDGIGEIEKCEALCRYYAEHAEQFLEDEIVETAASKSYVSFRPIGIVLAIMPWNFPFWQLFRFLAPALMAGNAGLLKHASNVTGCALAIGDLVKDAGFQQDLFQVMVCSSTEIASVIENNLIKAVTLTGSTAAGMRVAEQSGKLLKKTVLELGGSDPYLILADADLAHAAKVCASARLINNGQSCIAGKRFIVVQSVEEEFTRLFKAEMASRKTGDPLQEGTDLGPMARVDLRDELHEQVQECISQGAVCILGGTIPDFPGKHAYYEPTILSGIKEGMLVYTEEIFGPVAAIFTATDTADAVRIANDTLFGLGAAVFSQDLELAEDIARNQLQAGSCYINTNVKSDPKLPFGGINQSGYGRELGLYGIREFVNIKTVVLY